jgi:2-methylcitrate dehydratase
MTVVERPEYSRDYLDPDKRSIANAIQVTFRDGTQTPRIEIEYPLGHRRRRAEARPALVDKFRHNVAGKLQNVDQLASLFNDAETLDALSASQFVELTLRR